MFFTLNETVIDWRKRVYTITTQWYLKAEKSEALLAQSAEHQTFNLRVAGSSPAKGFIETHTAISELSYFENKPNVFRKKKLLGTMAEWSKAVDLSSTIFGCAGSNPAGTKPY